jgi:carboxypeptidase PM20D1
MKGARRPFAYVALLMLTAIIALTLIIAVRTWISSREIPVTALSYEVPAFDANTAAQHLSMALQFETVGNEESSAGPAFDAQREWLVATYPHFHAATKRTVVSEGTLVHEWRGSDPTLQPIILMAHQDVVPADSRERWQHAPFSGAIVDGSIWGRGAIDNKSSLVAILEAAESLAASGYAPVRTIYFVYGHDEETIGRGARAAAELLAQRNVRAAFVLDEGGVAIANHPLTQQPAALIAIAEKGLLNLQLSVTGTGGHSSMPPPTTAAEMLARAIVAIKDDAFPPEYGGTTKAMLDALAPHVPLGTRMAIANSWLFDSMLIGGLRRTPQGAATVQTTIATTMLQGSPKFNVVPTIATATLSFRLAPGHSVEAVIAHVRESIGDLPVTIAPVGPLEEPSPIARTDSAGYRLLAGIAKSQFEMPVAPMQALALTDSRSMKAIADDIYRFQPLQLTLAQTATVHGIDEHVSIENLQRMIEFYQQLLVGGGERALP